MQNSVYLFSGRHDAMKLVILVKMQEMSYFSPRELNVNEAENVLFLSSGWLQHLKFENTTEVT